MSKRALFLDRDGVINVDHGYVHKPEQVSFVEGIFPLVAAAIKANYLVIVITNQAGIGRGYYCEADFHALMSWMKLQFIAHNGRLDAVYHSPFHPEHGIGHFRQQTDCRKPAPGMLLKAQQEFGIDLANSIFIGDNPTDMMAGHAAKVGHCLAFRIPTRIPNTTPIEALSDAMPFLLQS